MISTINVFIPSQVYNYTSNSKKAFWPSLTLKSKSGHFVRFQVGLQWFACFNTFMRVVHKFVRYQISSIKINSNKITLLLYTAQELLCLEMGNKPIVQVYSAKV